jgi:protoporphyrin/coproporphyrin ferrochelatase
LPQEWQFQISYQSRVGPLKWIGPDTEHEIERAAGEKQGLIISPIAFVSEHIETLVELDMEYRELAEKLHLPFYIRAPALGVEPLFIDSLVEQIDLAMKRSVGIGSEAGGRICPSQFGLCPLHGTA